MLSKGVSKHSEVTQLYTFCDFCSEPFNVYDTFTIDKNGQCGLGTKDYVTELPPSVSLCNRPTCYGLKSHSYSTGPS